MAFSVVKSSGIPGYFTPGQYITFDRALTDDRNLFDVSSGTFTNPFDYEKIFEFSASLYHAEETDNAIIVEKNGIKELEFRAFFDFNTFQDTLSFTWMSKLKGGDHIRLKVSAGSFSCRPYQNCVFSGKMML